MRDFENGSPVARESLIVRQHIFYGGSVVVALGLIEAAFHSVPWVFAIGPWLFGAAAVIALITMADASVHMVRMFRYYRQQVAEYQTKKHALLPSSSVEERDNVAAAPKRNWRAIAAGLALPALAFIAWLIDFIVRLRSH